MGDHPTFEGKAACYAAGRKGYAQEVYDFIASQAPAGEYPVAADMGSGTGLFAQGLLERGYAVLGVEPLAQMREMAQDRLDSMVRYRAIPQSAENTGLDSGSIDFVTAGFGLPLVRLGPGPPGMGQSTAARRQGLCDPKLPRLRG